MQWVRKLFSEQVLLTLSYLLIAMIIIAPISDHSSLPLIVDYANHVSGIIQAKFAITEGQFPIRVTPIEVNGWRYPYFQFYAPTTYLIGGFIHKWLMPHNPQLLVQSFMVLGVTLGGIYINKLTFWFTQSKPAAWIASIVFISSPYMITLIDRLAALNEIIAIGITPAAIYYTLINYTRKPHYDSTTIKMLIAWYLLITIHIVTFVYTSLFTALLLICMTIQSPKHFRNLFFIGCIYSCSLLLAMWYLAPLGLMEKYLFVHQTTSSTNDFISYKPSFSKLIALSGYLFEQNLRKVHPGIGLPILIGFCTCLYAMIHQSRIKSQRGNYWLVSLLIAFSIAFIAVWSPVNFWQWLPSQLQIGQYCFRYQGQLIWLGAILLGWAVCWIFNNTITQRQTLLCIFLILIANSLWIPTNPLESGQPQKTLLKNSHMIFNSDAYLINFTQSVNVIDQVDEIVLYPLMENYIIQFKNQFIIPEKLLSYIVDPILILKGNNETKQTVEIDIRLNNQTIVKKQLKKGEYDLQIPLSSGLAKFKNTKELILTIKPGAHTTMDDKIKVTGLYLGHFLNPATTLRVKETTPLCKQEKTVTVCQINVPKTTEVIELPILYYNQLLNITINGKTVPYFSVVLHGNLLTGITPIPGQMNHIEIRFTGLTWANIVSRSAWLILFLFAIKLLIDQLRRRHEKS